VDRLARAYARERSDVLVIAYEDLVRDAEGPMRRLADSLGLDWNPVLVQATRGGAAWAGNSSFGDKAAGVADHSLRRWEQALTAKDVAMVERLLRDPMRARGDELVTDGRSGTWERLGFQAAALRTTWRARQDCRRAQRKQR
jgi:hypothetical protein